MTMENKQITPLRNTSERYFSKAIGNALCILELFQQSGRPLTLSEVRQQAKLPKSSAFRILRTLEVAGYLQRIDGDRFTLAGAVMVPNQPVKQVVEAARPLMRELSQEFRETISLAFLFDNHIEVAAVLDSPHRISMGNTVGGIIPPHASSLGKCITAFQPEGRRERLMRSFSLVRFTPDTIVEEVALNKELDLVRERGYAADFEESTPGGCCLGAPIIGKQGHAIAAISISTPKMRFNDQERLIAAVRQAAAAITSQLRTG